MTLPGTVYSLRQERFAASSADIIAITLAPLFSSSPTPPHGVRSLCPVLKRTTNRICHGERGRKGGCRVSHARQDDNAKDMHGAVLGEGQGRGRRSREHCIIALCITYPVYHLPTSAGQLRRRSRQGSSCPTLAPRVMCLVFEPVLIFQTRRSCLRHDILKPHTCPSVYSSCLTRFETAKARHCILI